MLKHEYHTGNNGGSHRERRLRDPELIPDVDIAARVCKDLFLDEKLPKHASGQGYVRVVKQSVRWNEMEASKVFTYQGLTTCTDVDTSWTIMSSAYNHVRHKKGVIEQGMEKFIREEVDYQEQLEAAGYRSPTWKVLRALQSLLAAEQLQGESVVTTPPFFPSAGRGTVQFWGDARGPTVFLWDGLDEAGRELCADVIHTRKDWVVWSRARPIKGDNTPREIEQAGKTFFCGKAKCNMKEQGGQEAEEEMEEEGSGNKVNVGGRARRQRGWWK